MRINKRTNSSIKRLNTFGLSYWEHNLYHIWEQNPEEKYITINYLKHIYHWWIGLPDSIFINVSVLFSLRWCCLDKMCSPASLPGLTYLIEVFYFVAFLAFCILGCTFLPWLVLWFSTSHTLPFHSWRFSRQLTVI